MDLTSIIGVVLGIALIVNGITIGKLGNFWDVGSALIVLGGTIAAVIASFPARVLLQVPKTLKFLVGKNPYNTQECIDTLVEFAQIARKSGLLALEEKANQLKDPFFKQSVLSVVDAMEASKLRSMLNNELDYMAERHEEVAGVYDRAAALAPAFGMVGTLVGLINMLKSMDLSGDGASSLGQDMSVALITTFYGSLLANLFFSPIAKKLRVRNDEEYLYKQIIVEGVISIQEGDNPKFLREKLTSFLSKSQTAKKGKKAGGETA